MERILDTLGRATARHPWRTIGAWLLVVVALLGIGGAAGGEFVNEYRVPGSDSQDATDLAQRHFPEVGAVSADVVWQADSGTLRDPANAEAIGAVLDDIRRQPDVRSAGDPLADGGGMLSDDGRTAISTVEYAKDLRDLPPEAADLLQQAAEQARDAGLTVEFRGQVIDLAAEPETSGAELIGIAAALVILLIAFGSLVAAGLPIVVALTGLAGGTALVMIAGAGLDIPSVAPIVAIMLGLGAGVDYALFVVTRFRHYLDQGLPKADAVGRALATAGHAVLFAGATVVAAILGLLLTGIPFIGGMGVAAALTVTMTMCAALTLLPAVLGLLGHRVNAVRIGRRRPATANAATGQAATAARWDRWAERVARHRYGYAGGAILVLLVLTIPLFSLRLGTPDDGNSPEDWTQHKAYEIVSEEFGPGWNAPLMVVAELPDGNAADQALTRLTDGLAADPEVATVTPPARTGDGGVAMLTVVPRHPPQEPEVGDLLHRIRDDLGPQAVPAGQGQVYVGGTTAFITDLDDAVGARLPWMVAAVLAAAAVLLIAMFRAPLIALKAALMAMLSIGAAFGVLVAIFQWGWGQSLVGIDEPVPILSMVPMLLFAVLFGLSMDYEVFMLTAIKEEYDRTGDPLHAMREGLRGTARVITAAAAIMTVVFLSFVPINDTVIKMIGVGLAVAVIVDVTIIRLVLAPAVMAILGHAAWRGIGRGRRTDPAPTAPADDRPAARRPAERDPAQAR
ncbi:MMPL family transporter [Streptomyces sp. 6N223]|uniref:MMPL family transporter n=1 Tax=Streptomyces sp. 6N223 TaxID=3457412 RepID=UPI003FD5CCBD